MPREGRHETEFIEKIQIDLIWFVTACLVFPLSSAIAKKGGNHKTQVKVMTRNLYLGADIFRVVEAAQIQILIPMD
jgi:hypothetical protein